MKQYQLQANRDGKSWINLGRGNDLEQLKFNSGIYKHVVINTPFIGVLGDTYRIIKTK